MGGRRYGADGTAWDESLTGWQALPSDPGGQFDRVIEIDAGAMTPYVTWGTNPGMVAPISGRVPDPSDAKTDTDRGATERALEYMGLRPNPKIEDISVDRRCIGSSTKSPDENLR